MSFYNFLNNFASGFTTGMFNMSPFCNNFFSSFNYCMPFNSIFNAFPSNMFLYPSINSCFPTMLNPPSPMPMPTQFVMPENIFTNVSPFTTYTQQDFDIPQLNNTDIFERHTTTRISTTTTKTETETSTSTKTSVTTAKTETENSTQKTRKKHNNRSISLRDNNQYNSIIIKYSNKYGVDPNLIKAMIKQESCFKSKAHSPAGAKGLMQLMPSTARFLGVTNPYDPEQNIQGGVKYIKQLLDRFNGNVKLALAGYNAGPGNVRNGKIPQNGETPKYVKNVIKYYNEYKSV